MTAQSPRETGSTSDESGKACPYGVVLRSGQYLEPMQPVVLEMALENRGRPAAKGKCLGMVIETLPDRPSSYTARVRLLYVPDRIGQQLTCSGPGSQELCNFCTRPPE